MNLNDDIAPLVLSKSGAIFCSVSLVSTRPSASKTGRIYSDNGVSCKIRPSPPFPIYHVAGAHNRTQAEEHTISTSRILPFAPSVVSSGGAFGVRLYAFPAVISSINLIRSSVSFCISSPVSPLVPSSDFVRCVVSARSAASKATRMAMSRRWTIGDAMYEQSDGVQPTTRLG